MRSLNGILFPLALALALSACTGPEQDQEPPPLPENVAALVGAWSALEADGSSCRVYLSERQQRGGRQAADQVCIGGALMQVQTWELRGDQLMLHGPRPALVLAPAGQGRFAGPGVTLVRQAEQ
ncbi:MAG: AprI/Inh family metalloprotease inhibitor [Paracoccus sp. (in: a-proteobacteria)]|uniref:AprI/Inh family metalloprotease inhibitor n=1 Tax=Paracoccus sp. TaxID=267 RepID=UPI0026DFCFBC|nr:AprI/Inh family metalloprotease inhibitor [Paracoccus sp. (in: a-proteobacteria)]MDO5613393.1 AprI/Inh family metalloprotease inhibitor [Paracoccus sp. (in: a-proteobacteria)]